MDLFLLYPIKAKKSEKYGGNSLGGAVVFRFRGAYNILLQTGCIHLS